MRSPRSTGTASSAGKESPRPNRQGSSMLHRIFGYARKLIDLSGNLKGMRDRRKRPRITTGTVVHSVLAMMLSRLGSLNALEQTSRGRFWKRLLGTDLPSADTMADVCTKMEADPIR